MRGNAYALSPTNRGAGVELLPYGYTFDASLGYSYYA